MILVVWSPFLCKVSSDVCIVNNEHYYCCILCIVNNEHYYCCILLYGYAEQLAMAESAMLIRNDDLRVPANHSFLLLILPTISGTLL